MINFGEIQEFYQEALEELKAFTQLRLQQTQTERISIEKEVERVEQAEKEIHEQVDEQLELRNRRKMELDEVKTSLNLALEKYDRVLEQLGNQAKAREETENKLAKIQREREVDQDDIEHRAIKLEASTGKIELYAKRCETVLASMMAQALQYEEEMKTVMRKQATSFTQLYSQMEKVYGEELTKRR